MGMSLMRANNLRLGVSERANCDPPWAWTANHRALVEAMLRQHGSTVGSFLVRMGVPAKDIEARIARVFLEAHRRGGCPPIGASSAAWLAAIALDVVEVGLTRASGAMPESIPEFLLMLQPLARAMFILFEIDRETSVSIAAAFGLSVEEVRERIHQNQRTFRRAHRDLGSETAPAPILEPLSDVG
jgi:DNA-directed RNA polymerase specialized sigma24 family protein